MSNSLVSGNTSNVGAGIYIDADNSSILQATSSAIVDNTASGAGNAGGGSTSGRRLQPRRLPRRHGGGQRVDTGSRVRPRQRLRLPARSEAARWPTAPWPATGRSAGVEQDCARLGASPQGLPLGSAGGNVTGDTSCGFVTTSDRQGAGAQGYWMTATDGGIFNYNAGFLRLRGRQATQRAGRRLAHTPGNQGYWEVASDGGVFSFGDAGFFGSEGWQAPQCARGGHRLDAGRQGLRRGRLRRRRLQLR